ncbi:MAG: winged helix-turn-helix transcriptional regulator [Elusimicrobia bacterium]|nr:winged helix-turn-helix transcriptional regulator [Elusimicrobiota bacterium]
MAKERLIMKKIREILRLGLSFGLSYRQIARSCKVSRTAVSEYVKKAEAAGVLSWSEIEGMSEEELKKKLKLSKELVNVKAIKPIPEYAKIQEELRNKHVTLILLWQEYKEQYSDGYEYVQYCNLYRAWKGKQHYCMRQEHRGGEKLFVDYCDGLEIVDRVTGEIKKTKKKKIVKN